MNTRYWFTDTVDVELTYVGEGGLTVDADFDPAGAETVTRDDGWTDFFGTDEFVAFDATVAQPIVQSYYFDDEVRRFRKAESELRDAQPQIENLPWTMGHPPKDRVTNADQIRGVWTEPRWADGQEATLHVPANDPDAVRFAVTNDEVSIGFGGTLDWTDDTDAEYDATQRNIAYDHIASVEEGRCSPEDGCGLHTDNDPHGHVADAVQTKMTEEQHKGGGDGEMNPTYSEGDWVSWSWQGGTAIGRVETVSTSRELSSSGATRDPTEKGEPAYKIEHYDTESGSFGNMKVAYESNLDSASEPDGFSDGVADANTYYEYDAEHIERMEDAGHTYESAEAAAEAASELGCDGTHSHETDDGTVIYMPCASMERFDEVTDGSACGCDQSTSGYVGPCSPGPCNCGLHVAGDAEIGGTTIDLSVPEGAQSAAQAFLDAKSEGLVGSDCGTGVGTTSAEMIADGEVTAERLVGKIAPYLHSHEEDVTRDDHPSGWPEDAWSDCGDAMYAAWGWTSLLEWARRKADEIKRARGEDPVYGDDAFVDAPSGLHVEDGEWYGIAPSETADDEPKYDLNTCNDVRDAYNLRNNGDYTISTDTLVSRIKRAADAHDCPPEQRPWTDGSHDTDTEHMSDSNDDAEESTDDPTEFYDGEPSAEQLADDFAAVEMLIDQKERLETEKSDLKAEIDSLNEELRDARRPVFKEKAEELADLTTKWGDAEDLMARYDGDDADEQWSIDDIDEKLETVRDLAEDLTDADVSTPSGDGGDAGNGHDGPDSQSEATADQPTVADNDTTTDGADIERTEGGRYDLRSVRRA